MYEAFYGLSEKPFSILPDPSYLFMGRRHALAYSMLEYGVDHRAGFTAITGEVGCGKTTLIRHLLSQLDDEVSIGLISNTPSDIGELLRWVLLAFGQPYDAEQKVKLFDQLTQFLIGEYAKGRRTVLIIDEAQNLDVSTLEELRMLSNINADKDQLLQLVLVGQPELKTLLQRPELRQFAQRISSDFHIPPLTEDEVRNYVTHRLLVAGREKPLFDDDAIAIIARASEGVPRRINILCDTALVYGFSANQPFITIDVVKEVISDKMTYGVLADNSAAKREKPELKPLPQAVCDVETARSLFSRFSNDD